MPMSNKPNPAMELIPVDASNIDAWNTTYQEAFIPPRIHHLRNTFTHAIFTEGYTPAISAWRLSSYHDAFANDPYQYFFLVRDRATGTNAGAARWVLNLKTKTFDLDAELAQIDADYAEPDPVPDVNFAAFKLLRITQAKAKKAYLDGRAHVYLWLLGTVEDWRGRGVGRTAVEWGFQQAREHGVPVYLESGEEAVRTYEGWGFKNLGVLEYDARNVGFGRRAPFTAMIWEPSENPL